MDQANKIQERGTVQFEPNDQCTFCTALLSQLSQLYIVHIIDWLTVLHCIFAILLLNKLKSALQSGMYSVVHCTPLQQAVGEVAQGVPKLLWLNHLFVLVPFWKSKSIHRSPNQCTCCDVQWYLLRLFSTHVSYFAKFVLFINKKSIYEFNEAYGIAVRRFFWLNNRCWLNPAQCETSNMNSKKCR